MERREASELTASTRQGGSRRGFRVLKLAESCFRPWDAPLSRDAASLEQQLELSIDHVRSDRTDDDLLYELLVKTGYPLGGWVEALEVGGAKLYSSGGGTLLVCLEKRLTLDAIRAMAERCPERIVCLDAGFAGNDQLKANAVQIFKSKGITSFKTV